MIVVLAAAMLIGSLGSVPATATDTWQPRVGPAFNLPVSPKGSQRTALVRRVIGAVDHTPRGEYIRIAAYSFDRQDVADALIRAYRRGVHVQIVLNDNWISRATIRMRNKFGRNPNALSFVRLCEGSCRSGGGNLHTKVYAFTRTGAATDVIMTGSVNMTNRGVSLQWNDMVTLRSVPALHDTFVGVFNQLKYDRAVADSARWVYYEDAGMNAVFYRDKRTYTRVPSASEDPVMQRLNAVNCTAAPGYGINGRTVLRIHMFGWTRNRGLWIADKVASLQRQGCNIKVLGGSMGGDVRKTLVAAGVRVRSTDYKYLWVDGRRKADFYTHMKMLTVNGTLNGAGAKAVWTGSENWSTMSFYNDELTIGFANPAWVDRYNEHFEKVWTKYSHRYGRYPTTAPAYRG